MATPLASQPPSILDQLLTPVGDCLTPEVARHLVDLHVYADVQARLLWLSTYMGHSSITVTLDRYGHLLPGAEAEAAGMLDRYLELSPSDPPKPCLGGSQNSQNPAR